MSKTQYYELDSEDGSIVRWTGTRILGADSVINSLANKLPLPARHVFALDGLPVHLSVKKDYLVASMPLSSLSLRTIFRITDGVMVPQFKPTDRGDHIERSVVWVPPHDLRLYLALRMVPDGSGWKAREPYLFGVDARQVMKGLLRMPLPNQYADGKLCLGRLVETICGNTAMECFAKVKALFISSSWNSDAMPDMPKAERMFRFNPTTMEQRDFVKPPRWEEMTEDERGKPLWHWNMARYSNAFAEEAIQ